MKQTFNSILYPLIQEAGAAVGAFSAHGRAAPWSARVGRFPSARQFHSSASASPLHQHSSSINEFLSSFEATGRYVPEREGYVWVTEDDRLRQLAATHFQEHVDNFRITNVNSSLPAHSTVTVRNDAEQAGGLKRLELTANISAGGLPALWTAYIQSLLYKEGAFPKEMLPPTYVMPPNIRYSAAFGSSMQFSPSHATPMYTDPSFNTANIVKTTAIRTLFPGWDKPERDNYMIAEIHPSSFFNPKVIQVGLGYLYNEWRYKLCSRLGVKTIEDETIPLAITSGIVMDNVAEPLGQAVLLRKNTLRVAYNESETAEMVKLQEQLSRYGIECTRISPEEAREQSETMPHIGRGGSIWSIKGDGNVIPNIVDTLMEGIQRNGGRVIAGNVESILYSETDNHLSGITVMGSQDGFEVSTLFKTHHLFTSFGARSHYVKQGRIQSFRPVEPIISGTGYSAFLLVEGEMTAPVDSNNSHFTPLATATLENGKKTTLVKATCGGSIGTDSFCLDHAKNNLFYATEIIFPGKKVEILAVKSCSRPLNFQNSVKLQEVIPGFYAGTGFGGKGITDSAGLAATEVLDLLTEGVVPPGVRSSFRERYITEKQNQNAASAEKLQR